jgi:hypothetical protein
VTETEPEADGRLDCNNKATEESSASLPELKLLSMVTAKAEPAVPILAPAEVSTIGLVK